MHIGYTLHPPSYRTRPSFPYIIAHENLIALNFKGVKF
jgi:hypothetical protein